MTRLADGSSPSSCPQVRAAWIELAHAAEPADLSVARLVQRVGPVEAIEQIRRGSSGLRHQEGLQARLRGMTAVRAEERAHDLGVRIITRVDSEWPTQIEALDATTPHALWVLGAASLRLLALRSLSIVGARACTAYGEEVTRSWSAQLASEGWTIVSGAAFGIDAAAHRGALSADGVTVAMLAGGVDVPYPRAHASLLAAISDQGLVVSEVPLGEAVRRQRFLSRNRLIAALGRATVVVEASERSGTTATARTAASLMRPVLAVPGPVTSPASAGCHRMIADGTALLAADLDAVATVLEFDASRGRGACGTPPARESRGILDDTAIPLGADADEDEASRRDRLDHRERAVLDAMPARGWLGLADLVRESGLAMSDVLPSVSVLVVSGWLEEGAAGWRRIRGSAA